MAFASPILAVAVLWAAIHALTYALSPSTRAVLPTLARPVPSRRSVWNLSSTHVVLKSLHLRVQTTAWNVHHDLLAARLSANPRSPLSALLRHFYALGCAAAVLGMLGSVLLLLLTCIQSLLLLLHRHGAEPHLTHLMRRAQDPPLAPPPLTLKPIIPGVTVPLSHLLPILCAILLSQLIHELGHAVAAAHESIPMLSAGVSLTIIMPSAFVTFPAASLERLRPRARCRIIAAGPFHNAVFWCLLMAIGGFGLGSVLWRMAGYRDMSDLGRVVVDVSPNSPLHGYISAASLVTKLDDTSLGSLNHNDDRWTSYLVGTERSKTGSTGWCVDNSSFDNPDLCCSGVHANTSPSATATSCFISLAYPREMGCVNAVAILTNVTAQRCASVSNCPAATICVQPDATAQLLRLTIQELPTPDTMSGEAIILWSGPREEIWEEVQVGRLLPLLKFLPLWLPSLAAMIWDYLQMATLSLYLFNLLPLPYLDGSQLLNSMLDMTFSNLQADQFDVEALESSTAELRGQHTRVRWKDTIARVVPWTTTGVLGLCIVLGIVNHAS